MAYISPNTELHVLKGVPLDKSYNHTLFQVGPIGQYNSLFAFRKHSFSNLSYQRSGKGKIRISMLADSLYDCNYLMFRNTSYGDKWFYAFLDSIEYINDNTSEISYTIDVMQTWYFDYELGGCYVEREHTLTDKLNEHLVPENIDTGDLVVVNDWEFTYPDSIAPDSPLMYELVVFYTPNNTDGYIDGYDYDTNEFIVKPCKDADGNYVTGHILNGIYMGCRFYGLPMILSSAEATTQLTYKINKLITTILSDAVRGSIVNIVQVPYAVWQDWDESRISIFYSQQYMERRCYDNTKTTYYTPKNQKLYTNPFKQLVVSNNTGETATYKWECFTAGNLYQKQATFALMGVPVMSPEIMCYPQQYRGLTNDYESGLMLTDFPTPPWSEDSFSKWWSQNKSSYITSLVSTAIVAVGAVMATTATGGLAGLAMGGLSATAVTGAKVAIGSKIASSVGGLKSARNTPDQISGQANCSSLRTVQRRIGFKFYDMCVEKEKAKVIDDYFTMYGYAIKQLKVPNVRQDGVTLRPYWNYVKTLACIIHPKSGKGLPSDDEQSISEIYDNGITFWNSPENIGNYTLDNSPVIGG